MTGIVNMGFRFFLHRLRYTVRILNFLTYENGAAVQTGL